MLPVYVEVDVHMSNDALLVSLTLQVVKRGRGPEPPAPPGLDRADGGVHEPTAQV